MKKMDLWNEVNDNHSEFLFNLRERWQSESEYESIGEYLEVIKTLIPEATKIYKRPFGIDCQAEDGVINISVKVDGNYLKLLGKSV